MSSSTITNADGSEVGDAGYSYVLEVAEDSVAMMLVGISYSISSFFAPHRRNISPLFVLLCLLSLSGKRRYWRNRPSHAEIVSHRLPSSGRDGSENRYVALDSDWLTARFLTVS
jgi:hypothetical protein